jgi:hypothetical protein
MRIESRVLLVSHSAPRWALDHLFHRKPLEELLEGPFDWQPGWENFLPLPLPSAEPTSIDHR